jgi:hypothetical protein
MTIWGEKTAFWECGNGSEDLIKGREPGRAGMVTDGEREDVTWQAGRIRPIALLALVAAGPVLRHLCGGVGAADSATDPVPSSCSPAPDTTSTRGGGRC